jgi:hypothetical protein
VLVEVVVLNFLAALLLIHVVLVLVQLELYYSTIQTIMLNRG